MSEEKLVYSKKSRPSIPVEYEDGEYVLECATAGDREDWIAKRLEGYKLLADGSRTFTVPKDLKFSLLNACLSRTSPDNPKVKKKVSVAELRSWDPEFVEILFQKAKNLTGIDDTPVPSARHKLRAAFEECNPPVSFEEMKEWVDSLPEEQMGWLQNYFKPDEFEEGKA